MVRATGEADLPPQYEKGAALGSGFSGQVWAARDESRGGRLVAVKVLFKSVCDAHGLCYPPLEALIAEQMSHQNVVRFFDVLHEPERILLVQECLMGGDLFACMQEAGVFSELLARCCFSDILAGVEYVHARGIVHRDLKPENCVLDAEGTLKIIDFGLAARFVPGQVFNEFCGSPEYAAPEVLREEPHEGPPLDIWAAGIILYDMVLGCLPFAVEEAKLTTFELPVSLETDVSLELALLLRAILKENPSSRASIVTVKESAWMNLPIVVSAKFVSGQSLHIDSPLHRRVARERRNAVAADMGFWRGNLVMRSSNTETSSVATA